MNSGQFDLNLLVYLDVVLRERSVTRAADQLGISQPAMSNALKRLRRLFDDPLLVRTSTGMVATERADALQPAVRQILASVDRVVQPRGSFDPGQARGVVRIVASDYAESTLLPLVLPHLYAQAPGITLDVMTPSDVSFPDVEQGKVDLVINRFEDLPLSFHQQHLWQDGFSCLMGADHPLRDGFDLDAYLAARHIWVSKTGMGVGTGMDPGAVPRLGWVDEALSRIGKKRHIALFSRHYQAAMLLVEQNDLIVTLPSRAAALQQENPRVVVREPPFAIAPIQLQMAWCHLLHNHATHRWVRRLIAAAVREPVAAAE